MTFLKRSAQWLTVAALATMGLTAVVPNAVAEEPETEVEATEAEATEAEDFDQPASNIDPLEGLGTNNEGFETFGDTNNPFGLIHRAILAPSITSGEFQAQQRERISSEAEAFRQRQQEALREATEPQPAVDETVEGLDEVTEGDEI
jgi:hypothetical protein